MVLQARFKLADNWRRALASSATKLRRLQEAVRQVSVQHKLELVSRELQNSFKIAHMTISRIDKAIIENGGILDETQWYQIAKSFSRPFGVYIRLCETSQQLLREFNWAYRRRITEAGVDGLSIEEIGSKRLSLDDFGIFSELCAAIVASNSIACYGMSEALMIIGE